MLVPPGGFRQSWNDFADAITIGFDCTLGIGVEVAHGEPVRAFERPFEHPVGDAEPDELGYACGKYWPPAALTLEREFDDDVLFGCLVVGDGVTELASQLRKGEGDCSIRRVRMSCVVVRVMCQRAQRECCTRRYCATPGSALR